MDREAALKQAVLSAIAYWQPFYSMEWLRSWPADRALPPKFHTQVLREFYKIRMFRGRF
jgi:hypothetical protein